MLPNQEFSKMVIANAAEKGFAKSADIYPCRKQYQKQCQKKQKEMVGYIMVNRGIWAERENHYQYQIFKFNMILKFLNLLLKRK